MVARRSTLWCGFLEAGEKGGPVVRDSSLDTGNPATVYLFNLIRNRILEYRRDIVEPKLRELRPDELAMVKSLRAAFEAARGDFTPRNGFRPASLPRRRAKKDPTKTESANLDFDPDGPMPLDDDRPLLFDESEA